MAGTSGIELPIAVTEAIPDWKTLLFSGQAVIHDLLQVAKAHQFTLLQKPNHSKDLLTEISKLSVPTEHIEIER
jgi:hypothetical protein